MKTLLLHIALLLSCGLAMAQGRLDSIQKIDTVEIITVVTSSGPTPLQNPFRQQKLDSTDKVFYQASTLGEVLQENTGIYIKSYGSGALSTMGFRGMGASQTKVFWNGVPMNSGMNGTIDLTNLPVSLFDDIGVDLGGNTLKTASGSFGGGIAVGSKLPQYNKQLKGLAWYEAGSFGKHNTAIKLEGGTNKLQTKAGFIYRRSQNDFPFRNTTLFGEPTQTQNHAEFGQYAGLVEVYYAPKSKGLLFSNKFALQSFVSKTERNIPPTMLSANTFQAQSDWLALGRLSWEGKTYNDHHINANVTYKFDKINFTSRLPVIDSRNQTHSIVSQFEHRKAIFYSGEFEFTTRLEHTSQWAVTNNFDGVKYQPVTALLFNPEYKIGYDRLIVSVLLRQELVYNQLSPFLPSLSIRHKIIRGLYLSTNIFRNYRYPTLNDRYWSVGGNPDLQQEKGWGTEGKVGYDKYFNKGTKLECSVNAYYLDVQNWILWLPESSTGIWTPENVKRVKSRGVEALVKLDGKKNNWTYRFTANYHFNKATNETSGGAIGSSSGKILIYTPQHLGNASAMVSFKGYYLQYRQHICGKRYITSDNSQQLPAFTTGDLRIGKDFGKKLKGLSLYLAAENLWNAQYQNIAWRPMPGRNFSGGVRYEFAVKKK